jgi:hypothetical protein
MGEIRKHGIKNTVVCRHPPDGVVAAPCRAEQLRITTSVMVNLALFTMTAPPMTERE